MPFYRSPTLGIYHMKGKGLPFPCAAKVLENGKAAPCLVASEFLCDGRGYGRPLCNLPLCEVHAIQTGPNKHLCPACRTAASDASGQRSLFTHLVQQ